MSTKLVTTALVSVVLGFFAAATVGTIHAAPLPGPTPMPKPMPKPTITTKNLDGRFSGLEIAASGEILGVGFQESGGGGWAFKGCGARSADHPLLIAANGDSTHFAKIQVVDGCLKRYTVWDAG